MFLVPWILVNFYASLDKLYILWHNTVVELHSFWSTGSYNKAMYLKEIAYNLE